MTTWPSVTCPSPPMAACPLCRTARIVVERILGTVVPRLETPLMIQQAYLNSLDTPRPRIAQEPMTRPLRIGTRGSPLALWQANHVADRLRAAAPDRAVELVIIQTQGDRVPDRPLAQFGGDGLFTKAIQDALLDGQADVAVHSLKDLPTAPVAGLTLAAVPERAS